MKPTKSWNKKQGWKVEDMPEGAGSDELDSDDGDLGGMSHDGDDVQ